MKRCLLATMITLIVLTTYAATLSVALDGSGQYSVIQDAIEAANSGDSVLVYPGRYIENIDYIGKSITVCSLEASTNDSTYISNTIIDGNRNGSCVAFRNAEQNATLRGFSVTNGTGYVTFNDGTNGGGVLISNTYMTGSSISLINCDINGNYAELGAGISSINASLLLSGLNIHHNYSLASGGGILIMGGSTVVPSIVFDPINRCSVYENYGAGPVDVMIVDIPANIAMHLNMITVNPPSEFYIDRFANFSELLQYHDTVIAQQGYRSEINHDLYVSPEGDDSNSGLIPGEPMRTITKAMHLIASDSLNVKTVHLLPGVYEEGEDAQIYPIPIKSYTNLVGAGSEEVTLTSGVVSTLGLPRYINAVRNKHNNISGLTITESASSNRRIYKSSFTQKDLRLSDVKIVDVSVYEYGGAFYISKPTSVVLDKLVINNVTTPESAIYMNVMSNTKISNSSFMNITSTYSSPDTPGDDSWAMAVIDFRVKDSLIVENCVFANIQVQNNQSIGGFSAYNPESSSGVNISINNSMFENIRTNNSRGIFFGSTSNSSFDISNCTFYNNYGSSAAVGITGNVSMRNNIFYNPDANKEIVMYSTSTPQFVCNLDMDYNNIRGGSASILNASYLNSLSYGEHNQDADPMFASTVPDTPNYLRLTPGSPCIDNGTPDISGLSLLPYDLAGNNRIWNGRIDMGCYEFGSEPWVANDDPYTPVITDNIMAINYPNPFNPETTISFFLPQA
ncbi:MAG: choice-of-anchor Q domain-containing protein, partial [Candidatus Cloacimonetes bacterium]|nr:choice-of-anchor Q domain-containing protein [Candidatus Cloacimonadota bacterium]